MAKGTLINFYHGNLAPSGTIISNFDYAYTTNNNGALVQCEPWVNTNSAAKQLWVDNVCINPHLKLSTGTNTQTYFTLTTSQDATTGEVMQVLTFDPSGLSTGTPTIPDHWILNIAQYDSTNTYANEWEYFPTNNASEHSPVYRIIVKDKLSFDYSTGILSHAAITTTSTPGTISPAHGGTFTIIDSVTTDNYGHITAYTTKTVTLPANNNKTYTLTGDTDGALTMNSQIVANKYANAKIKLTDNSSPAVINTVTIYHKAENGGVGSVVSFKEQNTDSIEMEILKIDGGTF